MQFNKNTSSSKKSIIGLVVKSIFGLVIVLGVVFILNSIDFPTPKKETVSYTHLRAHETG